MDREKSFDLSEICQIEKEMTNALKTVTSHGIFSREVDKEELGDLVDMIKDLAETKRNCWEAHYYELVCEAMINWEDGESMGYNHNHLSNGRFASSGRGHYVSGFMPNYRQEPIIGNEKMGYSVDHEMKMAQNRYGNAYSEYEDAKRHYTETRSLEDKQHMDEKAKEHLEQSLMSLREIWNSADPTLKREMKMSLSDLVSEMPV